MALSAEFVAYVTDQLAPLGEVSVRRMFGGAGLYCRGVMFALITEDTLYLKADHTNRPDFEALGAAPFKPFPNKAMVMPYYEITADLLDNRELLAAWAVKALRAAHNGYRR
jgi:DNA transformation protein